MIDVAALDSHNLQQHEYIERMKHYNLKIQQVCMSNRLPLKNRRCMLVDIPAPDKVLSADAINAEDFNLVNFVLKFFLINIFFYNKFTFLY